MFWLSSKIQEPPKDGTRFLGYNEDRYETMGIWFYSNDAKMFQDEKNLIFHNDLQPTHWMYLPPPPPLNDEMTPLMKKLIVDYQVYVAEQFTLRNQLLEETNNEC